MNTLAEAQAYVGTTETCGQVQLRILKNEGLLPHLSVLEIGCGCLSAGVPLMQALNIGCYAGIEPNTWLVEAALADARVRQIASEANAVFLSNTHFDASELRRRFDFILSHSVLSHCGRSQLEPFLEHAEAVLSPTGKIVASLRLVEPNHYGHPGSPDGKESNFPDWQYPGVTYYRQETLASIAHDLGLISLLRPQHTQLLTRFVPKDYHDWMVFARPHT